MWETIVYLLGLNDFHWRGSIYQWFFYAGILLTFIFEKRKLPRIVFAWVPLLYMALIFNPICIRMLNLAGLSNPAYFVRLYSFMPLMYVIARGFTFLLNNCNAWIKLIGACLICTLICLTGKNIYLESWFTKAENYIKVPQETLEILESINIQDDQKVSVAPIDASAVYIRQVADVITPYGRFFDDLGIMLSMDPPDVHRVMELAGQQDVDYVIAHKTNATLSAFAGQGYKPYTLTENYAIFKVVGVPGIKRTLNKKGQVVSETYYDALGVPMVSDVGYTSIVFDYDADGYKVRETYLDKNGDLYSTSDGYNSINSDYYINGQRKTVSYRDLNENPIAVGGRYKTRYYYNTIGQIIKETYYDTEDKIVAEVGEGLPAGSNCLRFYEKTEGAHRDGDSIHFETKREGNCFSAVWFQLWDGLTGEYILTFGEGYEPSNIRGEYVHQLPNGLYKLVFKGNTNLKDETISSLEYLTEGETLYYNYDIEEFHEKEVSIRDFYIGRENRALMKK